MKFQHLPIVGLLACAATPPEDLTQDDPGAPLRGGSAGTPTTNDNRGGQSEMPQPSMGGAPNTDATMGGQAGGSAGMSGPVGMTGGTGGRTMPDPEVQPIVGGCQGYATRFWDCCKPHCGWSDNVSQGAPVRSCNVNNGCIGNDVQSACNGGGAHMCFEQVPWAVSDQLAYGYAATSNGDVCGKCFQLDFTGRSHNAGDDPGSKALQGKTMIVQALNVGHDVGGGQFDIAIPGGGVGAFNACSRQWGVSNQDLGEQYGGFLSRCKQRSGNNHEDVMACVKRSCKSVLTDRGLNTLALGCNWFVDWFKAADNPALRYQEVRCPDALNQRSGMRRSSAPSRQCN